jgi:hypothetical protein
MREKAALAFFIVYFRAKLRNYEIKTSFSLTPLRAEIGEKMRNYKIHPVFTLN